jgi:cytochrome c oxidase subunit 1
MGWELGNMMATVGAFLIAFSMLVFLHNMLRSIRKGELAGNDPWDGRTLEWSIPSPPPIYNFVEIPQVHSRDAFWEQKYPEGSATAQGTRASLQNEDGEGESYGPEGAHKRGIHLPGLSYYPLVASVGLFIGSFGFIYDFGFGHAPILSVLGLALTLIGIYGWALEPAADEVHG